MALLEVRDLRVQFDTYRDTVHAVGGVSFDLDEGETIGLVGESGSGKSVTNLALIGMIPSPPGTVNAKGMRFAGRDMLGLSPEELRRIRGNQIAMIFQDPMTSLNPLLTVGRQMTEVLEVHKGLSHAEARLACAKGLGEVGIPNPEARLDVYPHELSGGMRQRVMIAMALLCKPKILLADEPTTALDVTIQAQILELLADLQRNHGMAIIFVTHDLGVIAGTADRVLVMYGGRLVETAPTEPLFASAAHPYTRGLIESVSTLDGDPDVPLPSIPGQPPDLAALPPGCAFAPRCAYVMERCRRERPELMDLGDERLSSCFLAGQVMRGDVPAAHGGAGTA